MAQSNRQAVEANKIPDDQRFDFDMPRNGARIFEVTIYEETEEEDGSVTTSPMDLTGQTFVGAVKTSYEAAHPAFAVTVDLAGSDLENGVVRVIYDATAARSLGLGVVDCVHDLLRVDTDDVPHRVYAGLLEFSKGVAVPPED